MRAMTAKKMRKLSHGFEWQHGIRITAVPWACWGYCYMNGTGVEQDDEMARVWLKRAAECRDYDAIELLKNYYMIDDYDDFEYEDYGDEPVYDDEDDDWED